MDQLVALVHHAYLFWAEGALTIADRSRAAGGMLEHGATDGPSEGRPPPITPSSPSEDLGPGHRRTRRPSRWMDCFVRVTATELLGAGHLRAAPRPAGFSVVEAPVRAPEAAHAPTAARSSLRRCPAAAAAGLYSLVGAEELLELGWRPRCGASRGQWSALMDSLKDFMDKKAVAGAGADRLLPRAQGRESVPGPRLPHRGPGRRGLSGDLRPGSTTARSPRPRASARRRCRSSTELVTTGRASMLEELREQIPPGLVEMLAISGLGVAKIRQIHEVLGIDSLPELEEAALDGRLARLPRFGPKTSENILRGIAFLRQASAFRLLHHAADEAEGLRAALERLPGVPAPSSRATCGAAEVVRDMVVVLVADARRRSCSSGWPAAGRARVCRTGRAPRSPCASPAARARRSS